MKVRIDGTRNIHNFLAKIKGTHLVCKTKAHTNNIIFFFPPNPQYYLKTLQKLNVNFHDTHIVTPCYIESHYHTSLQVDINLIKLHSLQLNFTNHKMISTKNPIQLFIGHKFKYFMCCSIEHF